MAGAGPISARELAARSGCAERYVREWLNAQAAGGYVGYHAVSDTYELFPEQAMVLADENSPVFLPHAWQVPASMWFDEERAAEAFRNGSGVAWGEHHERLHCGLASFSRNVYRGSLVSDWLPALEGIANRLATGIAVADVGCGHGHSTILMAQAFPTSRFYGFDTHTTSIDEARRNSESTACSKPSANSGKNSSASTRQREPLARSGRAVP
jgi:2-polyprenyl-3-methyl-5-hydroxy-6-metoxy-1,4-benzoquinol methylase